MDILMRAAWVFLGTRKANIRYYNFAPIHVGGSTRSFIHFKHFISGLEFLHTSPSMRRTQRPTPPGVASLFCKKHSDSNGCVYSKAPKALLSDFGFVEYQAPLGGRARASRPSPLVQGLACAARVHARPRGHMEGQAQGADLEADLGTDPSPAPGRRRRAAADSEEPRWKRFGGGDGGGAGGRPCFGGCQLSSGGSPLALGFGRGVFWRGCLLSMGAKSEQR